MLQGTDPPHRDTLGCVLLHPIPFLAVRPSLPPVQQHRDGLNKQKQGGSPKDTVMFCGSSSVNTSRVGVTTYASAPAPNREVSSMSTMMASASSGGSTSLQGGCTAWGEGSGQGTAGGWMPHGHARCPTHAAQYHACLIQALHPTSIQACEVSTRTLRCGTMPRKAGGTHMTAMTCSGLDGSSMNALMSVPTPPSADTSSCASASNEGGKKEEPWAWIEGAGWGLNCEQKVCMGPSASL